VTAAIQDNMHFSGHLSFSLIRPVTRHEHGLDGVGMMQWILMFKAGYNTDNDKNHHHHHHHHHHNINCQDQSGGYTEVLDDPFSVHHCN